MDEIDLLIYTPSSFVCDKCKFRLEKQTIVASTGQVGIKKGGYEPEPCPNDGQMLRRVTWKEAFEEAADSRHELMIGLIESVELQNHYAKLLNMHDGGERKGFSSVATWIERLVEVGKIRRTNK